LLIIFAGKGVAVSAGCSFLKGDFLLEYRGIVKDDEADLSVLGTCIYQFSHKNKQL